jgi:hypothetical protein
VLDEYAVNVVAKYGDRVINRGVRRVALDGKTMRIDVTAIDQNRKKTAADVPRMGRRVRLRDVAAPPTVQRDL